MLKATLYYENGTVLIRGIGHIPFASFDPRANALRAPALYYRDVADYLRSSEITYDDRVLDLKPSPHIEVKDIKLRDYQERALKNWVRAGMRGCVELPTGAGKTVVGLKAIEKVNLASIVLVPTIDLMEQWVSVLAKALGLEIGRLGGGEDDLQAITVSTYDSAYIRASSLGNQFALVIFDEVHHLPSPGYRSIAEQLACPYRLGLTATIEREDGLHNDLPRLVGGGVIFRAGAQQLARERHLAGYDIERRQVRLLPEEMEEYRKNYDEYISAIRRLGFRMRGPNAFQKLVMISGRSKLARCAILARNRAMNVALNSRAKIDELRKILADNVGAKTIIFTQHNILVHDISRQFLIPFITHKSNKEERKDILEGFRQGRYTAIVTSKVLDEGVDVPDAELGIIVSGTGSGREFVQRLGRLLRPKQVARRARLIEIVSTDTREASMSSKRKRRLRKIDDGDGDGGR